MEADHLKYIMFILMMNRLGFVPIPVIKPVPEGRASFGEGLFVASAYWPGEECPPEWWKPYEVLGVIFSWDRAGLLDLCGLVEQWGEDGEVVACWSKKDQAGDTQKVEFPGLGPSSVSEIT